METTYNPITVHGIPLGSSYYRELYFCTTRVRIKLKFQIICSVPFTHQQCTDFPTFIMAGALTPGFKPMRICHVICHLARLFSATVDSVYVAHLAMRSSPDLAFSDHSDRFVHFDRRMPITFSEALDEQAHAEQSLEHNWCWVSVFIALGFSKLSDFKLVFEAPDYRGMSVLRCFSSFVPLFKVWDQFF